MSTLTALVRKADDAFRLHMRYIWGAPEPIRCASCGNFFRCDLIDIGHLFSRSNYQVRWHEHNVWPQCIECNRYQSGGRPIIHTLTDEEFFQLQQLAHDPCFRVDRSFILEKICAYEQTL